MSLRKPVLLLQLSGPSLRRAVTARLSGRDRCSSQNGLVQEFAGAAQVAKGLRQV
jgi:hypothetical protein